MARKYLNGEFWYVSNLSDEEARRRVLEHRGGPVIGASNMEVGVFETAEQANRVVRAVNQYGNMLETLKRTADHLRNAYDAAAAVQDGPAMHCHATALEDVRMAIADAEGTEPEKRAPWVRAIMVHDGEGGRA